VPRQLREKKEEGTLQSRVTSRYEWRTGVKARAPGPEGPAGPLES